MRDGVDRQALYAEMRALDASGRLRLKLSFGGWLRSASKAAGHISRVAVSFSAVGAGLVTFTLLQGHLHRILLPIGLVVLAVATWANVISNRRAREWRRAHPFEQWRLR